MGSLLFIKLCWAQSVAPNEPAKVFTPRGGLVQHPPASRMERLSKELGFEFLDLFAQELGSGDVLGWPWWEAPLTHRKFWPFNMETIGKVVPQTICLKMIIIDREARSFSLGTPLMDNPGLCCEHVFSLWQGPFYLEVLKLATSTNTWQYRW